MLKAKADVLLVETLIWALSLLWMTSGFRRAGAHTETWVFMMPIKFLPVWYFEQLPSWKNYGSTAALVFILQACGSQSVHNHCIPHRSAKLLLIMHCCWIMMMLILWCFCHKMLVICILQCKEVCFISLFSFFEWAALCRNSKKFQNKSSGIFWGCLQFSWYNNLRFCEHYYYISWPLFNMYWYFYIYTQNMFYSM